MAGRRFLNGGAVGGGSSMNNVLLQNQKPPYSSSDSLFISGFSPSFLGSRSMLSFEDVNGGKRSSGFFSFDTEENVDEDFNEYLHQPEDKKRRLKVDQVQFLEKSFEAENKLEPERKIQLAKDLGLQPRQVAIWFQNRRARWKTKQLEKDYDVLQAGYNSLKANYDNLLKEKERLKAEVLHLMDKLCLKETGNLELFGTEKLSEAPQQEHNAHLVCEGQVSEGTIVACKQEDLNSAKSDVFDSNSPHYNEGCHSSLLEPGDSSYIYEPEQSDLSQDEEDNLSKSLLPPQVCVFPKIGDTNYPDLPENSCYSGIPFDDQTFDFWLY